RGCMAFCFSSRRRHTRSSRDWSSDVCSSDLEALPMTEKEQDGNREQRERVARILHEALETCAPNAFVGEFRVGREITVDGSFDQIGRASCRESGCRGGRARRDEEHTEMPRTG